MSARAGSLSAALAASYLISLFRGSDVSLVLWSCRLYFRHSNNTSSHKKSKKSQWRIFYTCLFCPVPRHYEDAQVWHHAMSNSYSARTKSKPPLIFLFLSAVFLLDFLNFLSCSESLLHFHLSPFFASAMKQWNRTPHYVVSTLQTTSYFYGKLEIDVRHSSKFCHFTSVMFTL